MCPPPLKIDVPLPLYKGHFLQSYFNYSYFLTVGGSVKQLIKKVWPKFSQVTCPKS